MTFLTVLDVFNYGLVLIFGLFLSTDIAGGCADKRQQKLIFSLCPVFLIIQGVCWMIWGVSAVKMLYPLIVHIPLILILVLALKKRVGVALVSVCTAYFLCQLPRWVDLAVTSITGSLLAGEICYTIFIFPIFFLLRRYFVRAVHDAMTYSSQLLLLFGSLPLAYYLFDYATAVYSDALYVGIQALNEFLPTALILFYILFITAYHAQMQKRVQAELQSSVLEARLKQSRTEMETLRRAETQAAIYQHDIRHHLTMIGGFLAANKPKQAMAYIQKTQDDVDAITPKHFCENEPVDLLCSAFSDRAHRLGVQLKISAKLPKELSISDTELCSVVSNSLENALNAAAANPDEASKWVEFRCEIKQNKLLIEITNPCFEKVTMRNGLPVTDREGHGFGTLSIRAIAEQHHGLCSFEQNGGIFTLRVILPV